VKAPRLLAVASHPVVATFGVVLLTGELLSMIALTRFDSRWVIFLCGILAAAAIASVSRHANDRWLIARRTVQLKMLRSKLAEETRLRKHAERMFARSEGVAAQPAATVPETVPATVDSPADTDADSLVVQRIVTALERDEFCLFSQSIVPLGEGYRGPSLCEILLRLKVEEENHLPAGSFLSVAEEHGLLPHLDCWVVRTVLDRARAAGGAEPRVFRVNVAAATILEGGFAPFVLEQLALHGLDGGVLSFEFSEADVVASPDAYRDFIGALKDSGCRFAVSGFGRNPASLHALKKLGVDCVKLDGGIVLNVLRSPADLALLQVVNRVAHAAGMVTVAECVENDLTRAALKRIDTDFVQGFGISSPRMLGSPEGDVPPAVALPAAARIAA
jgi:EAL domain-containing protein (putative c-di-GMP-specific phosphodiesterase class I)